MTDRLDLDDQIYRTFDHCGTEPVQAKTGAHLIELIEARKIEPGLVFDQTLPLEQVAEGYRAMDERRAIKTLLRP